MDVRLVNSEREHVIMLLVFNYTAIEFPLKPYTWNRKYKLSFTDIDMKHLNIKIQCNETIGCHH